MPRVCNLRKFLKIKNKNLKNYEIQMLIFENLRKISKKLWLMDELCLGEHRFYKLNFFTANFVELFDDISAQT
ncbi:hypothetical protein BpHYR1_000410 [Brachionus plicatilis]|uniref:Uncharacterized protein n=1 Tax=Brachionus plicatilis TaxID=10195 RepID=A0A3M7QQ27_BRAPC|nr:hypothetical protein BpHYR1_000410 [Brachionus plicatilis]